nr:ubiquitin-conjugating enzyme E2 U isoform X8 [Odocoileus virginianus texanus]
MNPPVICLKKERLTTYTLGAGQGERRKMMVLNCQKSQINLTVLKDLNFIKQYYNWKKDDLRHTKEWSLRPRKCKLRVFHLEFRKETYPFCLMVLPLLSGIPSPHLSRLIPWQSAPQGWHEDPAQLCSVERSLLQAPVSPRPFLLEHSVPVSLSACGREIHLFTRNDRGRTVLVALYSLHLAWYLATSRHLIRVS